MPIEIKELVIEASLAKSPDKEEEAAQLLTEKDMDVITEKVTESVRSSGAITSEQRRELMEDILREVRKMLDDSWRR